MNIVIATPLGRGGKGGIDRIMDEVADELVRNPVSGLNHSFIITRGQFGAKFSAIQLPVAIATLILRKVTGRVHLVHINLSSHGSTSRKIILAKACRLLGIPYVIHLHGSRMRQYWASVAPRKHAKIVKMFGLASRVIVLGEVWRKFIEEMVPSAANRIIILPNATRRAKLIHVTATQVRILFLGRIGKRKGVPQLVEALAKLPRDGSWHATIAGDGDLNEVKAQIAAEGLLDMVSLPGWVGPSEVEQHLAGSDILVLPSFDENLPMSVIEGMAAGLAVVATPVGATEEIVHHNKTGLLVPPGDAEALAAALSLLVSDGAKRRLLGAAAREYHSQNLEVEPYVKRLAEIWQSAAGQ